MKRCNPDRKKNIQKISELGSALSKATIFFHEALSGRMGLNASDTKCMSFIMDSKAAVTAGDVANFAGLTTGAITGIIDRLENARLIERVRDTEDRRKVYLRANKGSFAKLIPMYSSLRNSVEKLTESYSESELKTIEDFLHKVVRVLESETKKF
jgi:DNA-binding MarR family transcriptional regulator